MISHESNKTVVIVLDYIYVMPAPISKSVNKASELFCKKPKQKLPNWTPLPNWLCWSVHAAVGARKYKVGTSSWLINAEIKQIKYFLADALSISTWCVLNVRITVFFMEYKMSVSKLYTVLREIKTLNCIWQGTCSCCKFLYNLRV